MNQVVKQKIRMFHRLTLGALLVGLCVAFAATRSEAQSPSSPGALEVDSAAFKVLPGEGERGTGLSDSAESAESVRSSDRANRTIERLNQLQREIRRLQRSTQDPADEFLDAPTGQSLGLSLGLSKGDEAGRWLADDDTSLDDSQGDSEPRWMRELQAKNRVEAIYQRIGVLKDLLDRQESDTDGGQKRVEDSSDLSDVEIVSVPLPTDPPSPADEGDGQDDSMMIDLEPEPDLGTPLVEGVQVLSNPVNSFELANSLFKTGNYTQALKSYEALLADEPEGMDRDWLRCLAANCYRIQGEFSTAESLYREVAASKEQSYPSHQSQWYLDYLTRRERIVAELQAIDLEVESLIPRE